MGGAERKGRRKEQGRNGKGESDECKGRKLGMKGKRAQERKKGKMGSNKSGGKKGRDGRKEGNDV